MALPPEILSRQIPMFSGGGAPYSGVGKGATSSWQVPDRYGHPEPHSVTVISDGNRWYIFDRLTEDAIKASKTIELIDRKNHIEHLFKQFEDTGMDLDHLAHEYNDIEEELMKRPNSPMYSLTIELDGDIVGP
jgi:hypothetical protein